MDVYLLVIFMKDGSINWNRTLDPVVPNSFPGEWEAACIIQPISFQTNHFKEVSG